MNTQQQAYINGFVKRASEYGINYNEAMTILKQASAETLDMSPGAMTASQAGKGSGGLFPGGARTMTPQQLKALGLPAPLPLEKIEPPALQGPTPSGIPLDMMSSFNPAHANDLGKATR